MASPADYFEGEAGFIMQEAGIRLAGFFGVLLIMALWERMAPRKQRVDILGRRWKDNLGLVAADTLMVRLLIPVLPVSLAVAAAENGWGLLNYIDLPPPASWLITVMVLDFIVYIQHVLFHVLPLLWRLHKVHHSDLDIDVTTGIRFHPFEILISTGIKLVAVVAFGFPAGAVLLFEVLLNAASLFNHSNVYIPLGLDRMIRLLIVTPDMHRVHHSIIMKESDRNFGFSFSWWDRLFGTYQAQPSAGHDGMTIGLAGIRRPNSFFRLLAMPFVKPESRP
jgi:sterol desaturase/sphingolipid hydroxylase (fatty acid hydroxylase superfamily)